MTITLKPELEAMIREDVARGSYDSAEQFVEAAVLAMHQRATGCSDTNQAMRDAVEAGWLSAEQGPLYTELEVTEFLESEIPGLRLRDEKAA